MFRCISHGKSFCFVLGALALLAFAHGGAAQPDKPNTDRAGDPLPAGALARMGTLRMRHGDNVSFVAFALEGKAILTAANDGSIRLWDRATGKEIRRFEVAGAPPQPIRPGGRVGGWNTLALGQSRIALSHDGKTLALVVGNSDIQLLDVETGKEIRHLKGPPEYLGYPIFSPDGKMIAARGTKRATYLIAADTGKELRQIRAEQPKAGNVGFAVGGFATGGGFAFSADGKSIATAELILDMQKISGHLRISDVDNGKQTAKIDIPPGIAAVAYSPNGKFLAFSARNGVALHEADTGKEIRTIAHKGAVASLAFTPDSETLAVKGVGQGVSLYETASGKLLRTLGEGDAGGNPNLVRINGGQTDGRDFALSPDGKVIAAANGQTLRFWNVANGKEQALAGGHRGAATAVLLTPDRKTMISRGSDGTIRRWNTADGKELGQFEEPKGTIGAVFALDGKTVALANSDGTIRLVAVADGTELHKLKGHTNGTAALAFAPNGNILASRGAVDGTIRLHDVASGGELKTITINNANPMGNPGGAVFINNGISSGTLSLAFSPDGETLAANVNTVNYIVRNPGGGAAQAALPGTLHMWDITTGKEIRKITLPTNRTVNHLAFSPDGRVLATENGDQTLSLWELASRRERALLGTPAGPVPGTPIMAGGGGFGIRGGAGPGSFATNTLAFSPDGALLAIRLGDRTVRVWEVAHTREIGAFKGHDGTIHAVAFAPDGQSLASASADTTLLTWDVSRLKREPKAAAIELTAKDVETLWADLVGDDAGKASRSILTLAAAPKQAVPLLREHLKPAPAPDHKKIDQWISDMDSTNFARRTKASEELEKLGDLALPALRKVLDTAPTPEVRRRIEPILEKLTTGVLTAEQVRLVRAVEVLDKLNSAEARQVLETLAKGAPGALPTRHAQAVLDRQARRSN
jgi:WD40 repeat protein